jgi:hypothetical protein
VNRQSAKTAKQTREPSAELDGLVHRVIGPALEVHRVLGPVFLESAVEEALCIELAHGGKATRLHLGLLITESVSVLRYGIRRAIRTN